MKTKGFKEPYIENINLKRVWIYSFTFCIAVYFGWTFGLKYFSQ